MTSRERGGEMGIDLVGQRDGGSGLLGTIAADKGGPAPHGGQLGEPDRRHEHSQPVDRVRERRINAAERVAEPVESRSELGLPNGGGLGGVAGPGPGHERPRSQRGPGVRDQRAGNGHLDPRRRQRTRSPGRDMVDRAHAAPGVRAEAATSDSVSA